MDDCYALHVAKTEIREGFNTGDPERILAQLAPAFQDHSFGFPSFARADAESVFRARLLALFTKYHVDFAPVIADTVLLGQAALMIGWHQVTLTSKRGSQAQRTQRTRFVEIWEKADAIWKLKIFIDNLAPPLALAAGTIAALQTGEMDPLAGCLATAAAEIRVKATEHALSEAGR